MALSKAGSPLAGVLRGRFVGESELISGVTRQTLWPKSNNQDLDKGLTEVSHRRHDEGQLLFVIT